MTKIILVIILMALPFHSLFSNEPKGTSTKKTAETTPRENYLNFSKVLVYPLAVSKDFTIMNAGTQSFKVEIMDKNYAPVMTFNANVDTKTTLALNGFENEVYIVKMTSEHEFHQFEIIVSNKKNRSPFKY